MISITWCSNHHNGACLYVLKLALCSTTCVVVGLTGRFKRKEAVDRYVCTIL